MTTLYINGKNMGEVIRYKQNMEARRWTFSMHDGYYISLDFDRIKLFTSAGDLQIVTF